MGNGCFAASRDTGAGAAPPPAARAITVENERCTEAGTGDSSPTPRRPADPEMDAYIDEIVAAAPGVDEELLRAERGKDFTFSGQEFLAKVVDVYDGDTIRVVFRFGGQLVQYRARMAGYDSPEMKPPRAKANRGEEIAAARAAKAALEGRVAGRLVTVACGEFDKYGRLLVTVYDRPGEKGESVNAWMVSGGHGVPYDGGTKTPF